MDINLELKEQMKYRNSMRTLIRLNEQIFKYYVDYKDININWDIGCYLNTLLESPVC